MTDVAITLQLIIGLAIVAGGMVLALSAVDRASRPLLRWAVIGLVCWGAWFALLPAIEGKHDSPAAIALGALVAYVLLRHSGQIVSILSGAEWWPPNQRETWVLTVWGRNLARPSWRKLNPVWLLFGNEDDGCWGPPKWRAGRRKTPWLAIRWWLRNPAHNLLWYGLGVADRDRTLIGGWAIPGRRGVMVMRTEVRLFGRVVSLPYLSILCKGVHAYAGWRPSGQLSIKVRLLRRGGGDGW